jgi:hypothetical protein
MMFDREGATMDERRQRLLANGAEQKRLAVKLRDVLQSAWLDYEKHGGIPHEQFWEEMAAPRSAGGSGRRTKRDT